MKTTLVIMAAGIGSRFGGGIKQLEPMGPNGEIIMDYSIHDAIEAGFNKVLFVIRKDIEKDFREIIGDRIEKICKRLNVEVGYAFQELKNLPEGFECPADRTKPWGTGHAILACLGQLNEPFAVINADDYYGKEAYKKLHDYLNDYSPAKPFDFCMAGFILKNTLSDNGSVTRGVCEVDKDGYLTAVKETYEIFKTPDGAKAGDTALDINAHVSMNMWGLTPEFMPLLQEGFKVFLANPEGNPLKKEYLLPIYIDELLKAGKVTVKLLETHDKWYGVTYKEDKQSVSDAIKGLIANGVYQVDLFSDL